MTQVACHKFLKYFCDTSLLHLKNESLTNYLHKRTRRLPRLDFFDLNFLFNKKLMLDISNTCPGWALPPVDKDNLAGLATIALALTFYCPALLMYVMVNRMVEPEKLVRYPNYILILVLHHGVVCAWDVFLLTIYFSNSKSMRSAVVKELKECLASVLGRFRAAQA